METTEHQLWNFSNALMFVIILLIVVFGGVYALGKVVNIKHIKKNWAEYRCSPTVMPFASMFGHNTAENFKFCMGNTFNIHAGSFFSSFGGILADFTGLLHTIFGAISSIRNTIATLGGGINVIFQEFTERISTFFFNLRLSAIRIKMLFGRMYAILFSVMYMGLSGITGMTSFTNTFLFSFLDTFCFPGETQILVKDKGNINIKDVKMGDILLPTESRVTGLFRFYSKGQPMVLIDNIKVSTNHYIKYTNPNTNISQWIKAGQHPRAIDAGLWESDEPLYCLDTHDNKIPIQNHIFLDYDETPQADNYTMTYIQSVLNGTKYDYTYDNLNKNISEYSPCLEELVKIRLKSGELKEAKNIKIGDKLSLGGEVIGIIKREVNEICKWGDISVTPSTLYWDKNTNKWIRFGQVYEIIKTIPQNMVSFIVIPNSQIELENGIIIRDYMELCSPDSEKYYTNQLEKTKAE
jgi:P2-related tail formation protein